MLLSKGRDPRRELEEQTAFEEAERRRAEARASAVFESLIDASPVAIEIFDTRGNPLKSNKAAERLLGKPPPPGIPLFDERGLKRAGLLEPQLKRVLAGARVETPPTWYDPTEIGLPGIPGRKVCFRATIFPLLDPDGNVVRIAVMYEDITELKRVEDALREAQTTPPTSALSDLKTDAREIEFARRKIEQALREAEERYRALVESAKGYVIIRFTDDGRILTVSPSIQELIGISREALLADNSLLFAQVHPDDIARVRETEAQVRKTGEYPTDYQFRLVNHASGAISWVEMHGSACTFASRRTFEAILFDITGRKRIEELLKDKETGFALLAASTTDGIFTIDKEWIVTNWSKGAEQETRVTADEALGKRLWEVYPNLEKSGFALPFRKTLLDREPQFYEGFYDDGRDRLAGWFTISTYPFGGGVLAIVRNITQRKRIEQAWQETDTRLRAIWENPTVLVAFKDRNLRYVAANPAAIRLLSQDPTQSIIGKTDAEIFPGPAAALLDSHDRDVLSKGQPTEVELAVTAPKASAPVWLHITKQPWRSQSGEIIGVVDIAFDITSRVRAQQELNRRREALQKLLAEETQLLQKAQDELARWTKQ